MKFKPSGAPYVDARGYQYVKGDEYKIAVGIHHDILVTSGYGGSDPNDTQQRLGTMRNQQRITQVFTSAYDTRFARGREYSKPLTQNIKNVSRMLLKGSYGGTIWAAASKNGKKIVSDAYWWWFVQK